MKRLLLVVLVVILLCATTISAFGQDIFALRTALNTTPNNQTTCSISIAAGQVLEFSTRDIERRLSLEEGALDGITITSLPAASQGGLYMDGVEVEAYDFIGREELDKLCFAPSDAASGANVTFLPKGRDAVSTSLTIQILAAPNKPPEIEDAVCETSKNVARSGIITANDPEGGSVHLQVVKKPQKGTVTLHGQQYTYTPYRDLTGSDNFAVCAVDSSNEYSREATVSVHISDDKEDFAYADMSQHPSNYAALKLHYAGVMSGINRGGVHLFQPDSRMTRGEYLLLLLHASDNNETSPTINTGLPNDSQLPTWIKPYVKTAIDAGILAPNQPFRFNDIPTRAEAVVLCDRAAKIDDVKEFDLKLPDTAQIPDWALSAYKDLAAYRMLDLHDGNANPADALTNSYSADLIWQLYKHKAVA